ncbi:Bug family tripartite tricarboxylate transporter substrate binding protein [Teichococcus vastitatis]|uniref:Tripartite tricarboxylate transporter substrate binding protein n=1 Tax=Teichococcus vastitatis TaxID=2307076 RepID=A0ABS9W1N0_9PROT|nr:tripartite tricarboxylate transporter substrate binding protein [Pseudoroseomonas vastitatis]MCI0753207.1 tripartite tricarboxylate transporter substrate binding protein [Pseudoroseomonas vastitatis]
MTVNRRGLIVGTAALGAFAALGRPGLVRNARAASAWPERPITVVVPFPPGGGVDQMARLMAQAAQRHLPNSTFIVENRPGAGSQIGMEYAFTARPDGYTLCAVTSPAMMTIPYERPVRYRVAEFDYLANVVDDPGGLWVKQDSPIRDLGDLLQRAKTTSGGLSLGTTGIGSDDHLLMLELEQAVPGAKFSHVPFNGAAPLQTAVLGGHLDVGCFNVSEGNPGFRDGRFRCLAQAGAQRDPALPEIATLTEQGVAVVAGAQRGIVGPPGMPAEVRQALLSAFGAALADPQFQADARKAQLPLKPMVGEEYRKAVLGLDARLQEMWSRKPWRDQ